MGGQVRTLYLGGGTPSMLSPGHLRRLFGGLRDCLDFGGLAEVTLEANPATFDGRKAALFVELGVTRVSLGVQSLTPHVLATLGREHDPGQAVESVRVLKEAGVGSVNVDLMFSVPGQDEGDWRDTLERVLALGVEHVSAYNLTYEEDTAFFESLRRGEMREDADADAVMFHLAEDMLTAGGFEHYETSNYARPGQRSVHNAGYWAGEDYIGLGPSAVSTVAGVRHANVADTARYVQMVGSLGQAVVSSESVDPEAWRIERIALGLRTDAGIPLVLLDAAGRERVRVLEAEGLARVEGEVLRLIGRGRALVDAVAGELI